MFKNAQFYIFENIYKNKFYKIMIWCIILMSCYFTARKYSFMGVWENMALSLTDHYFLALCFLPISFLLTGRIYESYRENNFFKSRFKSEKEYMKSIELSVIKMQTLYLLIIVIVINILINLFSFNSYEIVYLTSFKMNSFILFLYSAVKMYVFIIIVSVINVRLLAKFKSLSIGIFNSVLYIFILSNALTQNGMIRRPFTLFIGNSLTPVVMYENYYFAISDFILHSLLLIMFYIVLFRRKDKNEVCFSQ